jgi:hypothetical protein
VDPQAGTRNADAPAYERGAEAPVDSEPAANEPYRPEQTGGPEPKIT